MLAYSAGFLPFILHDRPTVGLHARACTWRSLEAHAEAAAPAVRPRLELQNVKFANLTFCKSYER
jgi:hypothetical protein